MTIQANSKGILLAREFHLNALKAADAWHAKERPGEELFWLLDACRHALSEVVQTTPSPREGTLQIGACHSELLLRTHDLFLYRFGSPPPLDNAPPPGLQDAVVLVLALWVLEYSSKGAAIAQLAATPAANTCLQSDLLWRSYIAGLAALSTSQPFVAPRRSFSGYARHWATYVQLLEAYSQGLGIAPATSAVEQSFASRNHDRRLIGDALFGDGEYPVLWDFQLAGIQRYVGGAA